MKVEDMALSLKKSFDFRNMLTKPINHKLMTMMKHLYDKKGYCQYLKDRKLLASCDAPGMGGGAKKA
jgi:hypothetical protein